jgi:hypothetical protein
VVHWRSVESHNPVVRAPMSLRLPTALVAGRSDQFSAQAEVLAVSMRGKVRGNIKFSYMILT